MTDKLLNIQSGALRSLEHVPMILLIVITASMLLTAMYYHSRALELLRSAVPPQLKSEILIRSNMKNLLNEEYIPEKARCYHDFSKKIAVLSLIPVSIFCAIANQVVPAALILFLLLVYALHNASSS